MRMIRSVVLLGTTVLGLIALIVVSPWLVRPLVGRAEEWNALAEVGQAYGGISAVLSGLAFCGIAISLLLQWRQVRLTHMLITRERHFELVKLGLEDSSLRIPAAYGQNEDEIRKTAYSHLWVAHWAFLWDTGSIGPAEARHLFDTLFRDETALAWWAEVGPTWSTTPGRRRRALMAITHEAHRAAVEARLEELDGPGGASDGNGAGEAPVPGRAAEASAPGASGAPGGASAS
jgi:hypothetical protein